MLGFLVGWVKLMESRLLVTEIVRFTVL
jgi:hypothetical protein